jgi:hypothetical protein
MRSLRFVFIYYVNTTNVLHQHDVSETSVIFRLFKSIVTPFILVVVDFYKTTGHCIPEKGTLHSHAARIANLAFLFHVL